MEGDSTIVGSNVVTSLLQRAPLLTSLLLRRQIVYCLCASFFLASPCVLYTHFCTFLSLF
eukprot:m.677129 g.677129  ORF g.677129 m.677129 type:complete len:60 (+) comp22793_c0_seq11:1717-1896(+)